MAANFLGLGINKRGLRFAPALWALCRSQLRWDPATRPAAPLFATLP